MQNPRVAYRYSNTTLVKVKYRCGIDAGYNTEFKYNTC